MRNDIFTRLSYAAQRTGWIIFTIFAIALILLASAVMVVAGLLGTLRRRDVVKGA
jgi:hypothetical protein